jgi:hypothetical protein
MAERLIVTTKILIQGLRRVKQAESLGVTVPLRQALTAVRFEQLRPQNKQTPQTKK